MRYREEWEGLDEADGWALLRQAIAGKPVDWAAISDVLWWAERRDEEEGLGLMERFLDYLRHQLRSHTASGGGWYAGQRKTWVLGGTEFVMRWIPAGRFLMGANEEDVAIAKNRTRKELPQSVVSITRGFWMGETPVTQRQYQAIMGYNPSEYQEAGLDAPVESVSWNDAVVFLNKLSEMEGALPCFENQAKPDYDDDWRGMDVLRCEGWRLPTDAEWEYAARAGVASPRYGELNNISWNAQNTLPPITFPPERRRTRPVGQKKPNPWGLHDVLGNVYEWCYDLGDREGGIDPLFVSEGKASIRGASVHTIEILFRFAHRGVLSLKRNRDSTLGFRIVRGVPYIDLSRYQEDWEDVLF